jgi:hypothetical protein
MGRKHPGDPNIARGRLVAVLIFDRVQRRFHFPSWHTGSYSWINLLVRNSPGWFMG